MPRGAPTKLTAETSMSIVDSIRSGMYLKHAAMRAGVHPHTVANWMGKGRDAKTGLHRDFFDAVTRARADAIARNVALIQVAARNDWRAAAWWLKTTLPDLFGDHEALRSRADADELVRDAGDRSNDVPVDEVAHAAAVYAVLEQAGMDVRALVAGTLEPEADDDDGVVDEAPPMLEGNGSPPV